MNLFWEGNKKENHLTDDTVQQIFEFNIHPHEQIISTVLCYNI